MVKPDERIERISRKDKRAFACFDRTKTVDQVLIIPCFGCCKYYIAQYNNTGKRNKDK
jgi:hypothetical protein